MLELKHKLTLNAAAIASPNLAKEFERDDLVALGNWALDGYKRDKDSRYSWEQKNQAALDLAMQVTVPKTTPWPNASNVAFPLVTIAATAFHARAYPAMLSGPEIVRYRNPDDLLRSWRIGAYMSYQLLQEDDTWEEGHDRLIYNIGIVGCAFKKSYFSHNKGHNLSELVMAKDFVLDYWAKSVDDCVRKTHCIPLFRNEIYEAVMRGTFVDVLNETWFTKPQLPQETDSNRDKRAGTNPPAEVDETTPFIGLEMHCWIDLDQDGYAEPYILTLEEQTGTVLRLVTRFTREQDIERTAKGKVIKIHADEHFTKYGLLPAPDGSIYDIGFGQLLGPLNDSVSTIINQLIDAGTMATAAGGFLGRGAKIRGGQATFSPFEWKRIDSTVDDLHKAVFPLPVREPSTVLFQLLGLLINYTQRVTGATDAVSGENPGQNTPAETNRSMVNQGMKIYNSIYKRMWKSFQQELRKLYVLNGRHLPTTKRADYLGNPDLVAPASDPYILSEEQALQQAMALKQAAMVTPGYNRDLVEKKYLRALRVDDIDQVFPGEKATGPLPNPKVQVEQLKAQVKQSELQSKEKLFALELISKLQLQEAQIRELEARAANEIAQANGVAAGHQIALFEAQIGAIKTHNDAIIDAVNALLKGQANEQRQTGDNGGGVSGMGSSSGNTGSKALPAPGAGHA